MNFWFAIFQIEPQLRFRSSKDLRLDYQQILQCMSRSQPRLSKRTTMCLILIGNTKNWYDAQKKVAAAFFFSKTCLLYFACTVIPYPKIAQICPYVSKEQLLILLKRTFKIAYSFWASKVCIITRWTNFSHIVHFSWFFE